MRHASALGLSQSLALNLPLALIFQWVPGRFPTSEGRDDNHFQDGNHQGAGEQQPRCERRGRGRDDQESVQEGRSEGNQPSLWTSARLGAALCLCPPALTPVLSTAHPGCESQFEAHLSWFQEVGCLLELGVKWEGNQNLGGR